MVKTDQQVSVLSYITQLNKDADEYTTYKVIYIARHGEGYHNQVSVLYYAIYGISLTNDM